MTDDSFFRPPCDAGKRLPTKRASNQRRDRLWDVYADNAPFAVVAATRKRDVWRIVAALADHGDFPFALSETVIKPCPPDQAARLRNRAKALGIEEQFLACVRNSMFLTFIGGLSLAESTIIPNRMVA